MAFAYYPTAWDCLDADQMSPRDRLVLLAIVEHADDRGKTWVGQARLARYTGYSQRTVRASLKALETREFIHRSPRGNGKGGRSTDIVRLRIPKAEIPSGKESPNGG
jgi:DNA-binding MarR family transcriptional regulator